MKKITFLLASMGVLACTVAVTALAFGGGPKLNTIFETKATSKSFTFDADHGSDQFESTPGPQDVNVTTGVSDPIHTTVAPEFMGPLTFGGERFVEAHPMSNHCGYFLQIGINNLTHFEIYMGVENDAGTVDMYSVELRDQYQSAVKEWGNTPFELDGDGNGTAHLVWDKGGTDGTVVEVCVYLYSMDDSDEANLYVSSLSLSWDC